MVENVIDRSQEDNISHNLQAFIVTKENHIKSHKDFQISLCYIYFTSFYATEDLIEHTFGLNTTYGIKFHTVINLLFILEMLLLAKEQLEWNRMLKRNVKV